VAVVVLWWLFGGIEQIFWFVLVCYFCNTILILIMSNPPKVKARRTYFRKNFDKRIMKFNQDVDSPELGANNDFDNDEHNDINDENNEHNDINEENNDTNEVNDNAKDNGENDSESSSSDEPEEENNDYVHDEVPNNLHIVNCKYDLSTWMSCHFQTLAYSKLSFRRKLDINRLQQRLSVDHQDISALQLINKISQTISGSTFFDFLLFFFIY
jgi:hypothetical protein